MVAYAQQEMDAAGEAPDASTTLFQDCTVAVVKVGFDRMQRAGEAHDAIGLQP